MPKFKSLLAVVTLWSLVTLTQLPGQSASTDPTVEGREFKVSTEVHANHSPSPISANVTIFLIDSVYDFRFSPGSPTPLEITTFDAASQSFELLDSARRLRLSIDKLQLLRIADGMRDELKQSDATRHLAFEEFNTESPPNANRVTVSNKRISYLADGRRLNDVSLARQYHMFLENYTLLSSSDPAQLPPFARMQLNREITKLGLLPERITRAIRDAEHPETESQATSEHRLALQLDDNDRKLIALAKQNLKEFRPVDLAGYRQLPAEDRTHTSDQ